MDKVLRIVKSAFLVFLIFGTCLPNLLIHDFSYVSGLASGLSLPKTMVETTEENWTNHHPPRWVQQRLARKSRRQKKFLSSSQSVTNPFESVPQRNPFPFEDAEPSSDEQFEDDDDSFKLGEDELDEIRQRILDSLGITRLPDSSAVNRTNEWRQRLRERQQSGFQPDDSEISQSSTRRRNWRQTYTFYDDGQRLNEDSSLSRYLHFKIPSHTDRRVQSVRAVLKYPKTSSSLRLQNRPPIVTSSWSEWDVSDIVKDWLNVSSSSSSSSSELIINCDNCTSDTFTAKERATIVASVWYTLPRTLKRTKRSEELKKWIPNKKKGATDCSLMRSRESSSGGDSTRHGKLCCRKSMRVSFAELKLDHVVVDPPDFDAYFCKGRCNGKHNFASTHALIQNFLHKHKKVPKPCCVPSKLSPLQVMYVDERGDVQSKIWHNAIVEECACS